MHIERIKDNKSAADRYIFGAVPNKKQTVVDLSVKANG